MENKKSPIAIIVVAIAILVAIVIFAKPGEKTANNQDTKGENDTQTEESTTQGDAGKIGKNEVEVSAATFDEKVVKGSAGKLVVVDAYAPWCPHCQVMGPIFTSLADEYAGKATFGKMNSDNQDPSVKDNFEYAVNTLNLQGYPTFFFYKDGKKVDERSGEMSKEEFKTMIEKYLK
jgi:thioredoxin 1